MAKKKKYETFKDVNITDETSVNKNLLKKFKQSEDYKKYIEYYINNPNELDSLYKVNKALTIKYRALNKIIGYKAPPLEEVLKNPEKQKEEFLRCKYDIVYWLENYCYVPIAGGNIPIMLNDELRTVARLFESSVTFAFMTSRQSSKTLIIISCLAWLFNFFPKVSEMLLNIKTADNKKNMRTFKDIIENMPEFLRTWNPKKNKDDADNVFEKTSSLGCKITGFVVDKTDPDLTARGSTGMAYIDEAAYIKNIKAAYKSMSFSANTYSKFARQTLTPSPTVFTSTPNAINLEEGLFFYNIIINAKEVTYNQIKNMMPWEIYDWFLSEGVIAFKVVTPWYRFPKRVEKSENIDPNNPNNLIHLYEDINVNMDLLKEKDAVAWKWLSETKKQVMYELSAIKKDIYLLFLNSAESSIFNEEDADRLLENKKPPLYSININYSDNEKDIANNKLVATLNIYEKIQSDSNYLMVIDPAISLTGDNISITVLDYNTSNVVAHCKTKTGKIRYAKNLIEKIFDNYFKNAVTVIERNNFGIALIELILDGNNTRLKSKLYYYFEKDKKNKYKTDIKKYGFNTDKTNRQLIINNFIEFCITNPEKIRSQDIIEEALTLENKKSKIQAMPGCHDDCVMSTGIGLYLINEEKQFLIKHFIDKVSYQISLIDVTSYNLPSKDYNKYRTKDRRTKVNNIKRRIETEIEDIELTKERLGDELFEEANKKTNKIGYLFKKINSI